MKKVFKIIGYCLLGLIALGIIGAALSDEEELDKTTLTSAQPDESTKEKPKNSSKEKEETVGIGEALSVGDVEFTVNKIEEETMLGDEYYSEKPTDGAVYKMVYTTIQNNKDEALTIDTSFFKLLIDGVEYSPTTSTVLIDQMFFLEQINPKLSKKGILIFEVPQDARNGQLHVQTGFWGTETGIINLQ